MRATGTRGSRAALALLLLAVTATLWVARAEAQVDPLWDHYKVYFVTPPIPPPPLPPITLRDQFGQSTHDVMVMDRFMNPVQKMHGPLIFPIHDPLTHYAWWQISPQPFSMTVTVTNQFGDQTLFVNDAQYLLNPALKNQVGPPPVRNHYKCYNVQGPPVDVPIGMTDQFDTWTATVLLPRFLCNPAEKEVGPPGAGGQTYPIVDPNQHYVCYDFQPFDPQPFTAFMTDQFVRDQTMVLNPGHMICVPTYKHGITSSTKDTWGRLKLLYR